MKFDLGRAGPNFWLLDPGTSRWYSKAGPKSGSIFGGNSFFDLDLETGFDTELSASFGSVVQSHSLPVSDSLSR